MPDPATGAIDPAAVPLNLPDKVPRTEAAIVEWALRCVVRDSNSGHQLL